VKADGVMQPQRKTKYLPFPISEGASGEDRADGTVGVTQNERKPEDNFTPYHGRSSLLAKSVKSQQLVAGFLRTFKTLTWKFELELEPKGNTLCPSIIRFLIVGSETFYRYTPKAANKL
jgi:hypothetical protein